VLSGDYYVMDAFWFDPDSGYRTWKKPNWPEGPDRSEMRVRHSMVYGILGKCKTKASRKTIHLDEFLMERLREHLSRTPYNQPDDWVFASPRSNGKKPFTTGSLNRWHLRPAAKRAGIDGPVGWHTLRRTFATLMIENGENVKVVQELMRHANSKLTLDAYAQSTTNAKRHAQRRIIEQVIPSLSSIPLTTSTVVQ